ncbi:MAG: 2-C-methyl-D-erythritol 4-phosphate cytidylyltransferase [Lachnospiraceae bacterium]|nr:2-C-methyl-D-erythritol 4-phosphate cytidylyltransferase [Lachnospiraceae bacterium]
MENKKCTIIIAAAGIGKRMGVDIPKQFLEIKGKPVLYYTVSAFEKNKNVDSVIIVTGKESIEYCQKDIVEKYSFKKVEAIVEGGKERQNSVHNALNALKDKNGIVLIHDGARPFIMQEDIDEIILSVKEYGSAVLAVKSKDTVKIADENGFVKETPDRSFIWNIQTPQGFDCSLIKEAYEKAEEDGFSGTDDSSLVERLGVRVKLVEGHYTNIKITTKDDLLVAEGFLEGME